MKINRGSCPSRHLFGIFLCLSFMIGSIEWAESSERCAGFGDLQSISLTDWEAGLGSWTVGSHDIVDPGTFDNPGWAVVGSLPDSRPGKAAFVANLNSGDCFGDDETGALTLDSPPILIPAGAPVPRVSVDHWVATEFEFDGGNFKISVNGGEFSLVPGSAIEINPYNITLETAENGNTNPLAGEEAFSGTNDQQSGDWAQSQVNLFGIAAEGDTIQLRLDFGVDGCGGEIGWYVDETQIYNCSAELPPSDCGNGVNDPGEQCDDGNTFIEDGCSNTCQIDEGWECTIAIPPGEVADGSFEAGTPNPSWTEASTNFGSPICNEANCTEFANTGPADGDYWAWFAGIDEYEEGSLSQAVVIPALVNELQFELEVSACDSASDYLEVLIDGVQELLVDGSSSLCGLIGYSTQTVDVSAYADDTGHTIEFHSESFAANLGVSNFFVDAVSLPGTPSICTLETPNLTLVKTVVNDSGGSADPTAWTLTASGLSGFSGTGPSVTSDPGFLPGVYDLSESGPAGYEASDWVCVGIAQDDADTLTLGSDDSAICTITNDDIFIPEEIFTDGFESN